MSRGDVLDGVPGWARAPVAKTWRSEWKGHTWRPSGLVGQLAAAAVGAKMLRR